MTPLQAVWIGFHIILFLSTWFGNLTVCVAIWQVRKLRTVSNAVIFSLALADLIMTVVFGFRIVALSRQTPYPTACHIFSELAITIICCIILHLTCISMDRFIAIKYPLRYKTVVTRRRMMGVIVATWLFSVIGTVVFPHSLPKAEYQEFLEYYDTFHLCMSNTHAHVRQFQNKSKVFAALILVFYFIIPFLLIFGSYGYVIKASRDQQVKLQNNAHLESEAMRKIELRVAVTYGIVIGAFLLCFLPLFIGSLYQELITEERSDMALTMQILSTVASVSACVNPGVYAWRSQDFRKAFKKIIIRNSGPKESRNKRTA